MSGSLMIIAMLTALLVLILAVLYLGRKLIRLRTPDPGGEAEEKLLKFNRLYLFISQMNQAIVKSTDERWLFETACRIAVETGKFRMAWIGSLQEDTHQIVPAVHAGEETGYLSGMRIASIAGGMGPGGMALREGMHFVFNDIETAPEMAPWRQAALERNYHSCIGLPIKRSGTIVGLFGLYASQKHFFDGDEIALLEDVARDISFALDLFEREGERKRMEEEKKAILNRISDSMVSVDRSWRYTYLNDAALSTHPLGREETLGKVIWDVHPEAHGTIFEEKYREAMETRRVVEVESYYAPMDTWFAVKAYPSEDGLTLFYNDVTKQKRAQQESINKEKRFRALIENSTDGLTVVSEYGMILDMGPSGEKILGYSRDELVGRIPQELVHPEDVAQAAEAFMAVLAAPGEIRWTEHRHLMPDGTWKWLEVSYKNLLHEPYLNAIVVNFQDVTEKKQAEIQLRKSEEKYRKAQTIGRMGHWELDVQKDVLTWSDEIYRIFEIEKGEFANNYEAFLKTMHPDDLDEFNRAREKAIESRYKFDHVHRIIGKNGRVKYVQEIGEMQYDRQGQPHFFTGTVQDITEQVAAQNEIINEGNLSNSIINSLPGVFCVFTQEGEFLRWNLHLVKATGYSPAEIRQMHPLDFFDAADRPAVAEKIQKVCQLGEADMRANLVTKTGKKIPFYFIGKSILYEDRSCFLGVGLDFSDKVRAQEKIKATTRQLRELAAHLQKVREEERIEIARDIHDDLGQQLTAVKIAMFRMARLAAGQEALEKGMESLIEMTGKVIESIRRIALRLRPGVLDDLGLVEAMKWQIEEFEKRYSIPVAAELSCLPKDLSPEISINLFRIFQETLTNIARHAAATRVEVLLRVKGPRVTLRVKDNGRGINVDEIKAKRTLGLLGMKERALSIGGHFEAKSQPGRGTTILIQIIPDK